MTESFHREGYAIKIILALSYWLVAKYAIVKETPGHLFSLPCSIFFYPEQTPEYGWETRWERDSRKMKAIGLSFLFWGCNRNL